MRKLETEPTVHGLSPIIHIVFPVQYPKVLLDDEVIAIIQETATEIAE